MTGLPLAASAYARGVLQTIAPDCVDARPVSVQASDESLILTCAARKRAARRVRVAANSFVLLIADEKIR
jgi:hypothetical protein